MPGKGVQIKFYCTNAKYFIGHPKASSLRATNVFLHECIKLALLYLVIIICYFIAA